MQGLTLLFWSWVPLFAAISKADYVPGQKGGAWTQDELLIVKAKIWALLNNKQASIWSNEASKSYREVVSKSKNAANFDPLPKSQWPAMNIHNDLGHFAAKLVRLAFHDCVKYKDGSGGCDGCVSWEGMGYRYRNQGTDRYQFLYPDVHKTSNNGLAFTIAIMEEIYTNPNYPSGAPKLSASLKSTGKSRADLWAFAGKVAIEFTTELNNYLCEGKPGNWQEIICDKYCNHEYRYGRRDCVTSNPIGYKADKPEVQPDPNGDGKSTQAFFKTNFNFNPQQTVAIMGAHTLGRFYYEHSAFKYTWTSREGDLFNNRYYKNIVADGTNEYFIEGYDKNECIRIGDADGKIGDVKWVPSFNGFTKGGGPVHWIKHHFACPQCKHFPKDPFQQMEFNKCCKNKPKNKACKPDWKPRVMDNSSVVLDNDDTQGCEQYRFAFGADEMACNAEIGLYYDFKVDEAGIPIGCKGLADFNMGVWNKAKRGDGKVNPGWLNQGRVPRRAFNPQCGLQKAGNTATFMKQYADDETRWLNDFVKAFEKMQRNGYKTVGRDSSKDLVNGPSTAGFCKIRGGIIRCTAN